MAPKKRVRIVNGEIVTDDGAPSTAPARGSHAGGAGGASFGQSGAVNFGGRAPAAQAPRQGQQEAAGGLPFDPSGQPEWVVEAAKFVGLDGSTVPFPAVPAIRLPARDVKRLHVAVVLAASLFVGVRVLLFAAVAYVMVNYGQQ